MSVFTKTLIVDGSLINPNPPYFNAIKAATQYFIDHQVGGTIIVEQGIYDFDEADDFEGLNVNTKTTVYIPSNVSIIGNGNVVIRITRSDISAFKNANTSNTNIKISGFKIIYDGPADTEEHPKLSTHLVYLTNCSKCRLKNLTITSNNKNIDREAFAICITSNTQNTCWGNIIEGCRIYDFGSASPGYYGGGIMVSGSTQLTNPQFNIIKNNIISQVGSISGDEECKGSGILIFYNVDPNDPDEPAVPNNMIISNNILFDLKGNHTEGVSSRAINYVLKGNIFDGCRVHGFYPSGATKCAAFGNISVNNDSTGIHLRYAYDQKSLNTEFHALTGNVCMENAEVGIHAQNGTNCCSFFGNQCNENVLGIRIQHETDPTKHPELHPENNCVAGNVAVNNTDESEADISVDEYGKQIVANNMGNLNL